MFQVDPRQAHVLQTDGSGVAVQTLDLRLPPAAGPLVAGSPWGFQVGYRDPAAGGAGLDDSDAIDIEIVP